MGKKVIPVLALGLGKEIGLQDVVTEQMADNQNKYFFNHRCNGHVSYSKFSLDLCLDAFCLVVVGFKFFGDGQAVNQSI